MASLVGSALFGDGAAAVVSVGRVARAAIGLSGRTCVATRSRLYPDSRDTMGWDVGAAASGSCCQPICPTWSSATSATTSPASSPTTT